MAFGLLFLLPGGLLQAQDANGAIKYAENRTDAVATYTAVDQEGQKVYWSLLTTDNAPSLLPDVDGTALVPADFADNGDFSISADGVLTFNIPPDHESPDDEAPGDNEYNVVVVASDGAPGSGTIDDPIQMGYKKVVVEVTEEDERGVITLSSLQPQVGVALTAALADPEAPSPAQLTWEWERSQSGSSGWEAIPSAVAASLTPDDDDVDHYLRVTATYDVASDDDTERTAQAVSVNVARAAPATANATAAFPSDPSDANNRSVDENLPAGTDVGDPVAATDTVDDVLTYSLSDTTTNSGHADNFEIDPATGQITVGSRIVLDHETTETYSVTVTATEASGDEVDAEITITVNDVNEAPMVTGGVTMQSHAEDDADETTDDDDVLTVATYTASDPETMSDDLTWSVEGADKDLFMIGESDGALVFKDAPNYEMPADAGGNNVYNVIVVATDDGVDADGENEMTAMREVVITVTNVEEDGTVKLSAQQPKVGVELTASVTDLDGGVTGEEWQWSWADTATAADGDFTDIEDAESATYTPVDADVGRFLRATVDYTDNNVGEDTDMETASHAVLARGDHEPEFADDESGERTIAEDADAEDPVGDPVAATDGDTDDVLTYTLSGRDAGSFTVGQDAPDTDDNEGGQIMVGADTKLDRETKPTHMVTVTATDPGGLSASVDVTITVTNVNEAPEVMGDAEIEYEENWTRDLETYTATDQEGQKVYWSLLTTDNAPSLLPDVDGTALVPADFADNGDFSISADGVLTFNIPPDHESPDDAGTDNEYMIVVVASDGAPGSGMTEDSIQMGYKKVVVEVTEEDERGVITLSSLQPQVGAALTAALADPEAPSPAQLTWEWERSRSKTSGFAPATGTGADTATYTPVDDDVRHYLRVTATYDVASDDDTERTAQAVSVNVARAAPETTDENAVFPPETDANDRSVDENLPAGTEVGDPVAATDTVDDVLTYSLAGAAAASFEIDPDTGQITVGSRTVLDHETTETYSVTVTATEASGDEVDAEITITVNDVNEAPMVTEGVTMQSHAEDDADVDTDDTTVLTVDTYMATDPDVGTTLTWSVEGADKDLFMIGESDGALVFKDAPNYEMPADAGSNNVYNVTVVATDDGVGADGENEMTAMRKVVITVTNVEEDGTVKLSAQQPKVGVELTASVTDLDGGVTGEEWQWSWADTATAADGDFTDIEDAESATYTPVDADVGRFLRATVDYTDNNVGEDTDMETASHAVLARGDHEPEFADDETGKRTIPENSAEGITVGAPVAATDGDTDDILTYTLSGRDAGSFTVGQDDPDTNGNEGGQIMVGADTKLDHETKPTHMVTVTATDPGGLSASVDVTITVADVNEAPTIMEGGLAVSGKSRVRVMEGMTSVGMYTASGPDKDMAMWTVEGADATYFSVGTTRGAMTELMFSTAPDYEMPRGMAGSSTNTNTYMVTVMADDGTNIDPHDVTVTVTNVDEDGTVRLSMVQPRVGVALTASLTDIDGGVSGVTWQWTRGGTIANDQIVGGTDIEDATSDSYTPTADDVGMYLQATARYTDGHGPRKEEMAVSANMVIMASTNTAPAFPGTEDGMRDVAENTAAGGNVGGPVEATDDDAGDTLTYALGGPDAALFAIDGATGQITVGAGTVLDYETRTTYMVTVTATDAADEMDLVDVTITVTNEEETGEVTLWAGTDALTMAPQVGDTITGAVMDPDGGVTGETWQWAKTMTPDMMASWMDIEGETNAAYMVAADDVGYYLRVMATYTDAVGTDMAMEYSMPTMMVGAEAEDTLLNRYDANANGEIDLDEVFTAIDDYFDYDDRLTLEEVYEIVDLYFES